MKPLLPLMIVMSIGAITVADEKSKDDLADKAGRVLRRNCLQCHHGAGSASKAKFDVRDVKSMIDNGVVIAGAAKDSLLWDLAHRGTMPPRSQPQLRSIVSSDTKTLAEWIDAGASEFPKPKIREPVTLQTSLEAIQKHLRKLREPRVQARQRYFSLMEMHNNPDVTNETLTLARAGLSKALNSLSWEREIALPQALEGTSDTVYAIDLQQIGWTDDQWKAIRSAYPFGVGFENLKDDELLLLDQDIIRMMDKEPLYKVRGDWFIATVTRPPLYHAVLYDLYLPELKHRTNDHTNPSNPKSMTAKDLETFLGVDVIADILQGDAKAMRCGFTPSGVSEQNRLLERHSSRFGAYWKSYDFKADNRRAILAQFPLGPVFHGNHFAKHAFEHDGGEIIFNLPNGLQAYMLVDGKDGRINAGPIEVVSDALKTSGSPAIVNGVSCFACHKQGMIDPPADEIRNFSLVFGNEKDQVRRLYPAMNVTMAKIDADAKQFLQAADKATGVFLRIGEDKERDFSGFPEPVSEVARQYALEELDITAVAAELNLVAQDGKQLNIGLLKTKIEGDDRLKQMGLGVLLRQDGKIKRAFWESTRGGASVMQVTAYVLDFSMRTFAQNK